MYGLLLLLVIAVLYNSVDFSSENNRESDESLVKIIKSKIPERFRCVHHYILRCRHCSHCAGHSL